MPKGLVERLQAGEDVLVAEGFLFELERRGYLKAGGYVPEVVIEHPDKVRSLHEEFAHAGSDVCLAFTYYGHLEKLRLIGRQNEAEKLKSGRGIENRSPGLPGVITLSPFTKTKTFDEVPYPEAFRKLQEGGACVIGFNCGYGPRTTLPLIKEIMKTYKGPVAAVPVPYQTYPECPRFLMLRNPETGNSDYPTGLPA